MSEIRLRLRNARWTVIQVTAVLAILVGSVVWARTTHATPGSGVTLVKLADGILSQTVRVKIQLDKQNHQEDANSNHENANSSIDVKRIQTYKITIAPGGFTGWHQHGGPHLIVVVSGVLTYYRGDDPTCTGVNYPAGTSIFDPGFTTHYVRNEGTVDVVNYVTQLLPDPGIFRIDIPAPGNPHCSF